MRNRVFILSAALVLGFFTACDNDPGFGETPQLEFVDIQPKMPVQFIDSIVITFRFKDGDGDLGDDNGQAANMVIRDNREWIPEDRSTSIYNLPNLTPETKNPAIQGTVTVQLPPTALQPGLDQEVTSFDIYVIDRSDNESNTITTEPITILKN